MTPLIAELKKRTEHMVCLEHNKRATITANGENIKIDCCCDAFQKKVKDVMTSATQDHARQIMSGLVRGLKGK